MSNEKNYLSLFAFHFCIRKRILAKSPSLDLHYFPNSCMIYSSLKPFANLFHFIILSKYDVQYSNFYLFGQGLTRSILILVIALDRLGYKMQIPNQRKLVNDM